MKDFKLKKRVPKTHGGLQKILHEVQKIPLLKREEEIEYGLKAREGCEESRSKLIYHNLRFIVQVAKMYQEIGVPLGDLISYSVIGAIKALNGYDPYAVKFISRAVWYIRAEILYCIPRPESIVKLPTNHFVNLNRIQNFSRRVLAETGIEPKIEFIAESLDMSEHTARNILQYTPTKFSLDVPRYIYGEMLAELGWNFDDENLCYDSKDWESMIDGIYVEEKEPMFNESLSIDIDRSLEVLTTREQDILRLYYGIGCQQLEMEVICKLMNLTYERVRQIKEKAIRRLRHFSRRHILQKYLG